MDELTDKERIEALEREVAALKTRMQLLEYRPTYVPVPYPQPYPVYPSPYLPPSYPYYTTCGTSITIT